MEVIVGSASFIVLEPAGELRLSIIIEKKMLGYWALTAYKNSR
jgi:hypothetical protein